MESALSEEDEDDDDDVIALTGPPMGPNNQSGETNRFGSLDKMVLLLAALVEKSRSEEDNLIHLSEQDMNALTGLGPDPRTASAMRPNSSSSASSSAVSSRLPAAATAIGEADEGAAAASRPPPPLVFLYNITRDNINTCQTCHLIFSLTRHDQPLAERVAEMVFQVHTEGH